MKNEVNVKDREPKVEYLRMALAMAEFGVSYEHADLINEVTNKVKSMGGKFSIEDGVKLFFDWKKKWEQYHSEKIEDKAVV